MPRYSVDLSINTKGYTEGLEQAKQANAQFDSTVKETDKSTLSLQKELSKARNAVKKLSLEYMKMTEAERNSATGNALKVKIDETKKYAAQLLDLNMDINDELRTMASDTAGLDAMKQGMEVAKSATLAYAGAVAKLTGNEESLKDVVATLTMIENGFNTAIGITNALQSKSAIMKGIAIIQSKAAAAAKRTEAIATGQLAAAETAKTAATAAATTATVAETAATGKATIAQAAFNAVANANPYVLLATTLIALATAVGGYIFATRNAATEQKKLNAEIEKSKKEADSYASSVGQSYGKLRASYESLRSQWNQLQTAQEKSKFLKKYKTEIDKLTDAVHDLNSADDFFNKNSSKVILSFEYRAQAAAAAALAIESYQKAMELSVKSTKAVSMNGAHISEGIWKTLPAELQKYTEKVWDSEGRLSYVFAGLTSKQDKLVKSANLYSKSLREQSQAAKADAQVFENLNKKYTKLAQANNPYSEGGGDDGPTKKQLTELERYEKKVEDVETKIKNLKKNSPTLEIDRKKLEADLDAAKKELQDYRIAIGLDEPTSVVDEWEEGIKNELKVAQKELKLALYFDDAEAAKQAKNRIKELSKKLGKVNIKVNVDEDELDEFTRNLRKKQREYENAYFLAVEVNDKDAKKAAIEGYQQCQEEADKHSITVAIKPKVDKSEVDEIMKELNAPKQAKYDFNFLPDKYKKQAEEMRDRLDQLTEARKKFQDIIDKGKIDKTIDPKEIEKAQKGLADTANEYNNLTAACERFNTASSKIGDRVEDLNKFKDAVSNINNVVSSIDGVVGAFERLDDAFSDNASGWEKFMAVWNMLMSVMQAVITVMTVINTIQDIMNAKNTVGNGLILAKAAGHSATATAQGVETGTTTALAAAETAAIAPTMGLYKAVKMLAAAQIFSAHAYIPFAGPGIAAGYVTMMESLLAGLMAFANGGIVNGSSFYGDHMLARVNSGEMILNRQQQKNLFDAIDQNKLGSVGSNNVVVTGKIRGKDLLLVQKNYNTIGAKSGQSIKI